MSGVMEDIKLPMSWSLLKLFEYLGVHYVIPSPVYMFPIIIRRHQKL